MSSLFLFQVSMHYYTTRIALKSSKKIRSILYALMMYMETFISSYG